MVALRVVFPNITRGVFCHSCLVMGVWRCLTLDVGDLNTPLLFCRAGVVVVKRLRSRKIRVDMAIIVASGSCSWRRSIDILNGVFGKGFKGRAYQHGACSVGNHLVAWFPPLGRNAAEWAKYGNSAQTGFENIISPSGDKIRMRNLHPLNPCRKTLITEFSNDLHLVFARYIAQKRQYQFVGGFVYVGTNAKGERIYKRVLNRMTDLFPWVDGKTVASALKRRGKIGDGKE